MFLKQISMACLLTLALTAQVQAAPVWEGNTTLANLLDARGSSCGSVRGCSQCVAISDCAFSKVTFECQNKKEGSKEQVQSNVGCPQMNQMQSVFPAAKGKKAGLIPDNVSKEFTRISHHIFDGESSNKNSGRHTTSAWLKAHPGDKPIAQNAATHILEFKPQKTVWDSDFYSDLDIMNMCAVSIQLGGINAPVPGKAFVVQSPFGQTLTQGKR
ncbi:hypothetical protein HETIRDRAFT_451269 [Heterobasidion irregulare TC 32-1]|uniref:Uncharacterized protein n=1 Tax=Heterobasidion irregulare (strain TC 32-1) TaxID=747525 RepID=W4K6R3_HETIT|nr:uncharacterized protein HETIRDRAFT_451269 [Heterobasidion irregulare TC 32-1]ETW81493.1 hypothetical protein HETIRDRAFT_451269 [Heterobasidion irregulare TC 32-1]